MSGFEVLCSRFPEKHPGGENLLRAVLFDMDGVLFDSMANHTLAWYRVISGLGIPCTRDEFYLYEGATGKWTINRMFNRAYGRDATEHEIRSVYAMKSQAFNKLPEAGPLPGALMMLEEVKRAGLIPVLVTGSGQHSLLERLDREFPGIFRKETMVTAFDVNHGKPHPEPYLLGLEKAGTEASGAIVVENAPLGIQSARSAGIFTIAVNTGPIPSSRLMEAGADLLYPDMLSLFAGFRQFCEAVRL